MNIRIIAIIIQELLIILRNEYVSIHVTLYIFQRKIRFLTKQYIHTKIIKMSPCVKINKKWE